jgi:CubicO group peptidase (beta-lactamase class C family)
MGVSKLGSFERRTASRAPNLMRTSLPNTIAICFTVAVTTSITACGDDGGSNPSGTPDIPDRFRAFSSQFELERQALGIPGAAVAILEHGELAFAHGFGTKGIASREPVDAATLFRVGSMGKVLTSIGVLSAVDEGLLSLDAPIRDAIPDLSLQGPESERLSLRQLMSQQSGLRDYIAILGPSDDAGLAAFTSGPELAENVDFMNPPGLFWNYSNPNFYLAGRALEAQAQTTYRDAIDERVLSPLRMDRSFFLAEDVIADGDYSNGYGVNDVEGDGDLEDLAPDAYENSWARPAGFAFSNVLDWTHLMLFLMSGDSTVISDAAHAQLVAPQISTHSIYADVKEVALGLGDDYGFGIGVSDGFFMDRRGEPDTYYPVPYLGHGGDIPGFATTFAVFPSTGFGIVVLSNRDALRPVDSIRLALESFGGLPEPSTPPSGRDVDPSRFSRYAGTFADVDGTSTEIRVEAGVVSVSSASLDNLGFPYEPVLEPTSLDNFALWITLGEQRVPLEVTFFENDSGEYDWLRSRVTVARRVAPEPTPAVAP